MNGSPTRRFRIRARGRGGETPLLAAMETRSAARERDAAGARDAPVSSSPTEMDVGGMDASTFRPASPPRRASVSGAPRNENAGGSAGTSATARDTDADRQDVIPWSNADPTRRVRTARHFRPIPRPTHLPRAPPRTEPHVSKASRPLVSLPLPSRRVIPRFRLAHLTDSSDARVFSSKFRLRLGALSSLSFLSRAGGSRVSRAPARAHDDRLDRPVQAHQPQLLRD